MLQCVNIIVITQQGEGRNNEYTLNFLNQFEGSSTWANLTDTLSITIPTKVYMQDGNKHNVLVHAANSGRQNLGGFLTDTPFLKRGDKIQFYTGYRFYDIDGTYVNSTSLRFNGYISKVHSGKPFKIDCQDEMWLLKQTPAKAAVWSGKKFNEMLKAMLKGTGVTLSDKADIKLNYNAGGFTVPSGYTVAQVLQKIKDELGFYSYIRDGVLRVGYPIYYPEDARIRTFEFQRNIIESDLQYIRRDDIKLSALVKFVKQTETGETTKSGGKKTKSTPYQILVWFDKGEFKYTIYKDGEQPPPNTEGERRTFNYPYGMPLDKVLMNASKKLSVYYYDGFRGNFVTFDYPEVRHGDIIQLINPVFPDQNGKYMVKEVEIFGGADAGLRQRIHIDRLAELATEEYENNLEQGAIKAAEIVEQ